MQKLKDFFFFIFHFLGVFHLSSKLITNKMYLLGYHGIELLDESQYKPSTFIKKQTFVQRLQIIKKYGYEILSFEEAFSRMQRKDLPRNAVVISVDEGFYTFGSMMAEILKSFQCPAMVYLTTYYMEKQNPIFRLVVQYMFWKTSLQEVELDPCAWTEEKKVDLSTPEKRTKAAYQCISYAEKHVSEEERVEICKQLGQWLGVSYDRIVESRVFHILTREEVQNLVKEGFYFQLHTHRHTFPSDNEENAIKEIRDNRKAMEDLVDKPLVHLAYPGGIWSSIQWPWLEKEGIKTAATGMSGWNDSKTPPLALLRFLDSEALSRFTFEAEISGFLPLLRSIQSSIKQSLGFKEKVGMY